MAKPKDSESYDVAGTRYRQHEDPRSALKQAFAGYRSPDPTRNFTHRMSGDSVTIFLHCHERGLGDVNRRASQVDAMSKLMDEYIKGLKRRYRELGAGTLDMTEVKSGRGYRLNKVSLNDRWDIVYHRVYDVADLTEFPEED